MNSTGQIGQMRFLPSMTVFFGLGYVAFGMGKPSLPFRWYFRGFCKTFEKNPTLCALFIFKKTIAKAVRTHVLAAPPSFKLCP
jgi:hypothetical protein